MSSSQVKSFDRLPLGCLLSMDFIVRLVDQTHGRWSMEDVVASQRRTRMESSTSCGLGIHLIVSAESFQPDRAGYRACYREYCGCRLKACSYPPNAHVSFRLELACSASGETSLYLLVTCLRVTCLHVTMRCRSRVLRCALLKV